MNRGMGKKYIILSAIVGILVILVLIFFKDIESPEGIFEETVERTSQDYKIIDDSILINSSQND